MDLIARLIKIGACVNFSPDGDKYTLAVLARFLPQPPRLDRCLHRRIKSFFWRLAGIASAVNEEIEP